MITNISDVRVVSVLEKKRINTLLSCDKIGGSNFLRNYGKYLPHYMVYYIKEEISRPGLSNFEFPHTHIPHQCHREQLSVPTARCLADRSLYALILSHAPPCMAAHLVSHLEFFPIPHNSSVSNSAVYADMPWDRFSGVAVPALVAGPGGVADVFHFLIISGFV
jgi:hypothetical protein